MKAKTTSYGINPAGPFNINDVDAAIYKKWKKTLIGHPVIIYKRTMTQETDTNVEKLVFDPKHATSNFSNEVFTEIKVNTQRLNSTPPVLP